jgi:hypothetical protein
MAILDDYQGEVLSLADWKRLEGRASIDLFRDTLGLAGQHRARSAGGRGGAGAGAA